MQDEFNRVLTINMSDYDETEEIPQWQRDRQEARRASRRNNLIDDILARAAHREGREVMSERDAWINQAHIDGAIQAHGLAILTPRERRRSTAYTQEQEDRMAEERAQWTEYYDDPRTAQTLQAERDQEDDDAVVEQQQADPEEIQQIERREEEIQDRRDEDSVNDENSTDNDLSDSDQDEERAEKPYAQWAKLPAGLRRAKPAAMPTSTARSHGRLQQPRDPRTGRFVSAARKRR